MEREILKKNFENHGFKTSFFETKEEAAEYLKEQVRGEIIAIGGSMTVKELGLYELLEKENEVIWHWVVPGGETLKKAREAGVYLTSANGVAQTGELVNIDGNGNRVSQTLFGPKKTYFIVGSNKIAPDLSGAFYRAKNIACPKNAMRLQAKTPCVANGGDRCYDCSSPERICHATVILDRPCRGMEAEVVFINEELGY